MNAEVILRLLATLGIITIGVAVYWLLNRIVLLRAATQTAPGMLAGTPTVLYFTTPTCVPCKTVQRPALQRLQEQVGESVQVVEIDASASPEVASQWGVLSVPTTFIIDSQGKPRHVNHGVAPLEKLLKQIEALD
jgi:thiol-disulfide isomerase/thioredoxin